MSDSRGLVSARSVQEFRKKLFPIIGMAADEGLRDLLHEVLAFVDSEERLSAILPYLMEDLTVLSRYRETPFEPAVRDACQALATMFPKAVRPQGAVPQQIRPMGTATMEILRRPLLSSTDYNMFTFLLQSLRSPDKFDLGQVLDARNPEYFRYEVVNELREAFACVQHVLLYRQEALRDPKVQDWAEKLFRESGPLVKMSVFRKLNWAVRLRKSLEGSQEAYKSSEFDFEKLLLQVSKILGPSGDIFYDQARALYNCERWLGVNRVDLVVKHLTIKRPELGASLKQSFVAWKDRLVAMHDARRQLWDLAFTGKDDVVLSENLYEEILVSVGMYSDFMGTLAMVKDLLKTARDTSNVRLLAQLLSLLLRRLLEEVRRYQCWGHGEFVSTEKVIQVRTLEITMELQQMIRLGAQKNDYLPLEVFLAATVVYRELLLIIFEDKARDHIKATEREILAESPLRPNSLFLFEKKTSLSTTGAKFRLVPSHESWEPFSNHYQFQEGGLTKIFETKQDVVLQEVNSWLTQGILKEGAGSLAS